MPRSEVVTFGVRSDGTTRIPKRLTAAFWRYSREPLPIALGATLIQRERDGRISVLLVCIDPTGRIDHEAMKICREKLEELKDA
jgi:hypothetical protein